MLTLNDNIFIHCFYYTYKLFTLQKINGYNMKCLNCLCFFIGKIYTIF